MKKFLIVFTVLLGFFSTSYAEFSITPISSTVGISGNNNFGGLTYGDYIGSQIHNICNNYYLNPDNSDYRTVYSNMVQNISDNGFDYVLINVNYISAGSYWYFSIYEKDTLDIGFYLDDSKLYELCLIDSAYTKSSPIYIYHGRKTNYAHYAKNYDVGQLMSLELTTVSSFSVIDSSVDVKQIKYSGGYYWDGESYFYEGETEPEIPSSDHDLAGLISAITSSEVVQDSVDTHKLEYFVVYTGEAFGEYFYDVYFYNKNINLSYFEYLDSGENLRYDLNKMSVDGVIGKISDFIAGDYMKCQQFKLSYNPETGDSSVGYVGKKNINEDLEGFSVDLTPLVYTSKDIPYYFYEYDEVTNQGIATPDTSKDIKTQVITDSEGNEISNVVTPSSTLVGDTTWNKVLNAILSIPESILAGIKKLFIPDLTYLEGTMENLKTKLGFITQARKIVEDITNGIELNPTAPPSISINLTNADSKYNWGTEAICLDLSWYAPFKPAVDFLIICFCYGFFFWNLFRKLPDIINGVAGDVPLMAYQAERVSNNSKREPIGFRTK